MSRISSDIREQVRQRSGGRCEYCHKPEAFSSHSHHVDHIISQKHKGSDALDNLAWACFQCNTCKGTDITGIDRETRDIVALYNPRTQTWSDHFRLYDVFITGLTPEGRVTIEILQMNHPDQIATRRLLVDHDLW